MRHYIGVVHKDTDSDYGVSFPDFPGAVTAARNIDEAIELAQEALALHVEGMLAEGETIPAPSGFDQLEAKLDGGALVLVPLKTDALVVRVNVTLPGPLLRRIDEHVDLQEGLTRSGFLATAAQRELSRLVQEEAQYGAHKLAQEGALYGAHNALEDLIGPGGMGGYRPIRGLPRQRKAPPQYGEAVQHKVPSVIGASPEQIAGALRQMISLREKGEKKQGAKKAKRMTHRKGQKAQPAKR